MDIISFTATSSCGPVTKEDAPDAMDSTCSSAVDVGCDGCAGAGAESGWDGGAGTGADVLGAVELDVGSVEADVLAGFVSEMAVLELGAATGVDALAGLVVAGDAFGCTGH